MTQEPLAEDAKLVVQTARGCRSCMRGEMHPNVMSISSIKAEEFKWVAKGKGLPEDNRTFCARCGALYREITHTVPILCEQFDCPKCGKAEKLHYKVNSITTEENQFEFEVEIECQGCSKKRSLKKILKSILEIIKLEVGPTGITVKNA